MPLVTFLRKSAVQYAKHSAPWSLQVVAISNRLALLCSRRLYTSKADDMLHIRKLNGF